MTEAEELQAILSEPGKAVGKYFDGQSGIFYAAADERAFPHADADPRGVVIVWATGKRKGKIDRVSARFPFGERVRKADPDRNLNLKVGMRVRLVNGDVETVLSVDQVEAKLSNGRSYGTCKLYGFDLSDFDGEYGGYHICEVIEEAENAGGLLDKVNERLRKVEREIVDIKNAQRELEGLV